ncbi:MAG: hypothetical protein B7X90_17135 [Novosphingobium sp. 17-62-19]|uniref:hypothetical protein n=1 Tax=Novosphingobium sp. 17-62-19 TaxID=1970406 RepID=UPI000BCCB1FC|nr:hypothetical protein [Novosphingobium sp. 17-62-19]OYX93278.1 MAG: hypothetical protein B7Y74_10070 [Novosphingobium sp. 35-62-5]OZA16814.1 MAG: hypothetical protein B7X90_17135 [Novosphingobium sp. 17-62-19]
MDFFKIIQSLEELLYEMMTWLVFYPRTLWRSFAHPIALLRYSDRELRDSPDQQFLELLSPPLFLLLTILLSHLIEVAMHQQLPIPTTEFGRAVLTSDQNLLILRALMFSIYPLLFAVTRLHIQHIPLNRQTLREPFFAQCYIAGPSALVLGLASILMRVPGDVPLLAGAAMALLSVIWYLTVEVIWFRVRLGLSLFIAVRTTIFTWLAAAFLNFLVSFLVIGLR